MRWIAVNLNKYSISIYARQIFLRERHLHGAKVATDENFSRILLLFSYFSVNVIKIWDEQKNTSQLTRDRFCQHDG